MEMLNEKEFDVEKEIASYEKYESYFDVLFSSVCKMNEINKEIAKVLNRCDANILTKLKHEQRALFNSVFVVVKDLFYYFNNIEIENYCEDIEKEKENLEQKETKSIEELKKCFFKRLISYLEDLMFELNETKVKKIKMMCLSELIDVFARDFAYTYNDLKKVLEINLSHEEFFELFNEVVDGKEVDKERIIKMLKYLNLKFRIEEFQKDLENVISEIKLENMKKL